MREKTARVLADVAYTAGNGDLEAKDVLALAEPVTHHDAVALIAWDPVAGTHREAAAVGYSADALTGLGDRYAATPEHRQLLELKTPLRIDDLPYNYRRTDIFREVLKPEGFREGMTSCLLLANGTYTGMIHLSAGSRGTFDEDAREFVGALAPVMALLALRTLSSTIDARPDLRVSIVDEQGRSHAVGAHELPKSALQASFSEAIRRFAQGPLPIARGLWPTPEGWLSVELHKVPSTPFRAGGVRVVESTAAFPFALSRREIDILQGIARGDSNQQIAQSRSISVRTVSTHVERLLEKTGQASRAGIVALAARHGLLLLDPRN